MSWLFGAFQKNNLADFNFSIEESNQKLKFDNLFISIGGNSDTSYLSHKNNRLLAYTGVLLEQNENRTKILNRINIEELSFLDPSKLDGHYVIVNYSNGILNIQNDTFGLRDLYFYQTEDLFLFSTRIDLIQHYISDSSINFENFSSFWLSNFQLSTKTLFTKIDRLGPGGKIICKHKSVKISYNTFTKTKIENAQNEFPNMLSQYCKQDGSGSNNLSLALSGGIDSRLILSQLLNSKENFSCYSLKNEADKDLEIAEKICSINNIEYTLLERTNLSLVNFESKIEQYYQNISPAIPLTQLLDFALYGAEYFTNKIILDGGFGGFYRRQYLNKIYIKGPKVFNIGNIDTLEALLYSPKPMIFNDEIFTQIKRGLNTDIHNLIQSFDKPQNKEELAEILDLISIKFMLPSVYGPGQTILDQNYISYMPLAQKSIINLSLNIPLKSKIDSRLIKTIIKETTKELTKIHLVNNNLKYTYWLNYKIAMINLMIYRKLFQKKNYSRYSVFINSKEYITEIIKNGELKNNQYLNHKIIVEKVDEFFAGNYSLGNFVDWVLTFHYWSKANKII